MKRVIAIALLAAATVLPIAGDIEASRVVRVRKGPHATRVRVTVRPGFPIRRILPVVVVRPAPVVRITPRVYLGPVAFTAVVLATPPPANVRVWSAGENLDREDGWTDFTMNVDKRGKRLMLEIENGPAQINFAEIVFENGDAQVVDFDEKVQSRGVYSLLDFNDGRKVDHVRFIAKAQREETTIRVHLVS